MISDFELLLISYESYSYAILWVGILYKWLADLQVEEPIV